MSSTSTPYQCRKCHQSRKPSEVVALTHTRTGQRTYLCRPSSDQLCFAHSVFDRDAELIRAVTDGAPGGDA